MGIRNSCRVELCDYFTPCGMDRGHPVVFGWQMGWFKESKMAPLTCLAFLGWLEGWAQQAPSTGASKHMASPVWWPQNSPATNRAALRVPRKWMFQQARWKMHGFVSLGLWSHMTLLLLCSVVEAVTNPLRLERRGIDAPPPNGRNVKVFIARFYNHHNWFIF